MSLLGGELRGEGGSTKHTSAHSMNTEDIIKQLNVRLESGSSPKESVTLLKECTDLFTLHRRNDVAWKIPAFLEILLTSIIKPVFSPSAQQSSFHMSFVNDSPKMWRDSAPWSLDILQWVLDQYGTLETPLRKRTIESHLSLLVPPILTLLDDDDPNQKKVGCRFLEMLALAVSSSQSNVLSRTGLTKVFEDSLAPNMLLLPSLTPEHDCFEVLSNLYPAYRALAKANFLSNSAQPSRKQATLGVSAGRENHCDEAIALDQHDRGQAMLDRILRNGLLAGYLHASDHVQIASLLVSEMSPILELMGASSAKYMPKLLPLFSNILTNPLGSAHPPLLKAAVIGLRQLILLCWPRVRDVWWEECLRMVIGLWLQIAEENGDAIYDLKRDAKGLISLLVQVKGPRESQESLHLLHAEYDQLRELVCEDCLL